jgi:hypothetical protein
MWTQRRDHTLVAARLAVDFPTALRAAIQASGLSLDRIQHRLEQRGVPVTVTSLSYWQTGKRRPERPESLAALKQLEQIFGLVTGSLVGLLGPRRPRGRGTPRSVPLEALWPGREELGRLVSRMRTGIDTGLTVISLHDRVEITADRGQRSLRVRQVMRAECDDVNRWVSIYDTEQPGQPLPRILPIQSCRLGWVARDPDAGLIATELLFDKPLRRGETTILEFEVVNAGPPYPHSNDSFTRKTRQPIRDYIAELWFDPRAVPNDCQQYTTRPNGARTTMCRQLPIDSSGRAHAVQLRVNPGTIHLMWSWPTED